MEFIDYNEIVRRRYEYAMGIDTKDFKLLRSVFTETITMDFQDYSGQPRSTLQADDWVANCKNLFTGLDATQHVMTNPIVDIDGERATCKMYMKAEHFLQNDQGNNDFALGGYYIDQLEKSRGRWLINAVTLKIFWNRGNRHIMTMGYERGSQKLLSLTDE
ncbi:MAG: nuclear transport factor 2 family protein [Pseudomonadota bacterium]